MTGLYADLAAYALMEDLDKVQRSPMADLKEVKGKNELDDLSPGFLWEMGLVATHGNAKYSRGNWQDGERRTYIAAMLRHLLKYAASYETSSQGCYDEETGLHHMAHIARSAEFIYWMDEGPEISNRQCRCAHCRPATPHCTSTVLGG